MVAVSECLLNSEDVIQHSSVRTEHNNIKQQMVFQSPSDTQIPFSSVQKIGKASCLKTAH